VTDRRSRGLGWQIISVGVGRASNALTATRRRTQANSAPRAGEKRAPAPLISLGVCQVLQRETRTRQPELDDRNFGKCTGLGLVRRSAPGCMEALEGTRPLLGEELSVAEENDVWCEGTTRMHSAQRIGGFKRLGLAADADVWQGRNLVALVVQLGRNTRGCGPGPQVFDL